MQTEAFGGHQFEVGDNFLVFPETPFRARFDLQYDRLCEGSTVCAKVCAVVLERLDAEFPPQSLEQCFCVFDVAAAYRIAQSPESEWSVFETATECRILRLLREGMGESDMGQMKAASRRFMSGLVRLMPRSSRTSNFKLH